MRVRATVAWIMLIAWGSSPSSTSVTANTGATGTEVEGDKDGKMKHNIGKAVALMN